MTAEHITRRMCLFLTSLIAGCGAVTHAPQRPGQAPEPAAARKTWRTFTTADGLPHDSIRALCVDGPRLWVGTDGGLGLYADQRWSAWTTIDGLPAAAVQAIAVDPERGDVWLGTWGGGVARFSGGRARTFDQFNSGLASDLVFDIAVSGGRVWAATATGLSGYDPVRDEWSLAFERRADAPEQAFTTLRVLQDRVLAGAWCGDVAEFDPASGRWSWAAVRVASVDPSVAAPAAADSATLALDITPQALWQVTPAGLRRWGLASAGALATRPRRWAAANLPRCLAVRSTGEAWVGTERGLDVLMDWPSNTWTSYRAGEHGPDGLPDDRVRCVALAGSHVWVGTAAGLALGTDGESSGARQAPDEPPPTTETLPTPAEVMTYRHAAPDGTPAVMIALLGPSSSTIALPSLTAPAKRVTYRPDIRACQLAIDEVNARGGYRDRRPFELITGPPGYARYGWGTPEDDLTDYASRPEVVGAVGRLPGGSRIAMAAALYTELPLMNVDAGPATIEEQQHPWLFRCRCQKPADSESRRTASRRFADAYRARFKQTPSADAERSYRGTLHLLAAIEAGGLQRARAPSPARHARLYNKSRMRLRRSQSQCPDRETGPQRFCERSRHNGRRAP